jgi:hypothetical protein
MTKQVGDAPMGFVASWSVLDIAIIIDPSARTLATKIVLAAILTACAPEHIAN